MGKSDHKKLHFAYLIIALLAMIISGINPKSYISWFAEVLPAIALIIFNLVIYKRFKFSHISYACMVFVSIYMAVGGHYTYGDVPLPHWLNDILIDIFNFKRNHYDRVGHFFQGFTIALISREILVRVPKLKRDIWLYFIVVSISLALGAFYELIEWAVAMINNSSDGGVFMGAQGDKWDAQWDMFVNLLGANIALLTLGKRQDVMLKGLH